MITPSILCGFLWESDNITVWSHLGDNWFKSHFAIGYPLPIFTEVLNLNFYHLWPYIFNLRAHDWALKNLIYLPWRCHVLDFLGKLTWVLTLTKRKMHTATATKLHSPSNAQRAGCIWLTIWFPRENQLEC